MFSVILDMKKEKSLIIYYLGIITGLILILIGIVGLFLPIIPGIIFIIIGIVLFGGGTIGGLIRKFKKRAKEVNNKIMPKQIQP